MGKSFMIGVDPGFTGAIALISSDQGELFILDTPLESGRFKTGKTTIDASNLVATLKGHMGQYFQAAAIIERVSAAPNQGVSSMFRFGEGYGVVQGVMAGLGIKVKTTPPSVWKPSLGLSSSKLESLEMARRLWPQNQDYFKRQKDHGRAEAALLAYYGVRNFLAPEDQKRFITVQRC